MEEEKYSSNYLLGSHLMLAHIHSNLKLFVSYPPTVTKCTSTFVAPSLLEEERTCRKTFVLKSLF